MKLIKNKKGMARSHGIKINWSNGSVSSLVAIAGIICITLGVALDKGELIFLGSVFVILALFAAVVITGIIRGRF